MTLPAAMKLLKCIRIVRIWKSSQPLSHSSASSSESLGAELEVYEAAPLRPFQNDSPDVGFSWSVNPYRGCFHACAYCSPARPTRPRLGAGTDFDRRYS